MLRLQRKGLSVLMQSAFIGSRKTGASGGSGEVKSLGAHTDIYTVRHKELHFFT